MKFRNDEYRYGLIARVLHWGSAVLFVGLFYLAWTMTELPLGVEKFEKYNLHKSLGLTLFTLVLARLAWRAVTPAPPLPADLPAPRRFAARVVQAGLYLGVVLQAGIGVLHSWLSGFSILAYGWFTIPSPLRPDRAWTETLGAIHSWIGWSILAMIVVHAGAACYHHFVLRDAVLASMLPGVRRRGG